MCNIPNELYPPDDYVDLAQAHYLTNITTNYWNYATWIPLYSIWRFPWGELTPSEAWKRGYRYYAVMRPDDAKVRLEQENIIKFLRGALEDIGYDTEAMINFKRNV